MAAVREKDTLDFVRRRLLKRGAYVPPAILGVVTAPAVAEAAILGGGAGGGGVAAAGRTKKCCGTVIVISAGGNACCPCVPTCPNGTPNPKYNPIKCGQKRCELNCAYCAGVCWPSLKKCQKEPGEKTPGGTCPCVCQQTAPGCWQCL